VSGGGARPGRMQDGGCWRRAVKSGSNSVKWYGQTEKKKSSQSGPTGNKRSPELEENFSREQGEGRQLGTRASKRFVCLQQHWQGKGLKLAAADRGPRSPWERSQLRLRIIGVKKGILRSQTNLTKAHEHRRKKNWKEGLKNRGRDSGRQKKKKRDRGGQSEVQLLRRRRAMAEKGGISVSPPGVSPPAA